MDHIATLRIALQSNGNNNVATPSVNATTTGTNQTIQVNSALVGTVDAYKTDGTSPAQGRIYLVSKPTSGAPGVSSDVGPGLNSGDQVVVTINDTNNSTTQFSNAATVP